MKTEIFIKKHFVENIDNVINLFKNFFIPHFIENLFEKDKTETLSTEGETKGETIYEIEDSKYIYIQILQTGFNHMIKKKDPVEYIKGKIMSPTNIVYFKSFYDVRKISIKIIKLLNNGKCQPDNLEIESTKKSKKNNLAIERVEKPHH